MTLKYIFNKSYTQASCDIIHKAWDVTISPEFIVCVGKDKCLNVIFAYVCYFLYKESVSERNGVTRFVDQGIKPLEVEFMYKMKILACKTCLVNITFSHLMSKIINFCNQSNKESEP